MKKRLFISIFLLFSFYLLEFKFLPVLSKNIKIGLVTSKNIDAGINESGKLINLVDGKAISNISRNDNLSFKVIENKIEIKKNNDILGLFTGPIKLSNKSNAGLIKCNNKWFRGELVLILRDNSITAINDIDIEDYLLSVVPSEMPHSWSIEALKAQSIAARTYAIGYFGRRIEKGYDLESSILDQVYNGVSAEKESTTMAVKDTNGLILADEKNTALITLFHSSGGGFTDSIENIWKFKKDIKPSKYIQPKPDYDDKSPYFNWERNFSYSKINNLLAELKVGQIKSFNPIGRSLSGRVLEIEITGEKAKKVLYGEELRMLLKLPSSKFTVSFNQSSINFTGKGYGHGLGLSQWGSKALAEKGFNYLQILTHYYNGARLIRISY